MSKIHWTPALDDGALNASLTAPSPGALARVQATYAQTIGATDHGVVARRLWGLATRLAEYTGPVLPRTACTWATATPCEVLLLRAAINSRSQEAKTKRAAPPDPPYLARLLNRPEEWVEKQLRILDPRRGMTPLTLIGKAP